MLKPDSHTNDQILSIPLDEIQVGLIVNISTEYAGTLFDQPDADNYGEVRWQLLEGGEYEFEFSDKRFTFEKIPGIIRHSRSDPSHGLIRPNTWTGTLTLAVSAAGGKVWPLQIEIRSRKVSYRSDYRLMLEYITEKCTDLLLTHTSPALQNFEPNYESGSKTLYQRFSFIRSIIDSDEFSEAMNRILSNPLERWVKQEELQDINRIRCFDKGIVRQIQNGGRRLSTNLHSFQDLPKQVRTIRHQETVDNPENRFIKHVLNIFLSFCADIEQRAGSGRTAREAARIVQRMEEYLDHALFRSVESPVTLKLNSPVLQRREGYRELFRVWLMFDLAARLVWKGGEDVYSGGKRNMAVLYEYWIFFQLLEVIQGIFKIDSESLSKLIRPTEDGLGLQLKKGKHLAISGVSTSGHRQLNVRFSFNRFFSKNPYPEGGSWSLPLRPDYTLSFWPAEMTDADAETHEMIVHIHFDAKYRTEHLFSDSANPEVGSGEKNTDQQRYKQEDLVKMHAYRDAIRRTAGAYILYPGNAPYNERGFRELLPGLGAFAVRPSRTNTGIDHVERFIREVRRHLMNRASQRERLSLHTWEIHKNEPTILQSAFPEFDSSHARIIPDTVSVLIAYYKSGEHLNWIKQHALYNFRFSGKYGLSELTPAIAGAKYLLLYTGKESTTSELWEIVSHPRYQSAKDLQELNYPDEPSQEVYLVVRIQKPTGTWFEKLNWNINDFSRTGKEPKHAPFTITLTDLMQKAESESD